MPAAAEYGLTDPKAPAAATAGDQAADETAKNQDKATDKAVETRDKSGPVVNDLPHGGHGRVG
jgi:hypothetical protein